MDGLPQATRAAALAARAATWLRDEEAHRTDGFGPSAGVLWPQLDAAACRVKDQLRVDADPRFGDPEPGPLADELQWPPGRQRPSPPPRELNVAADRSQDRPRRLGVGAWSEVESPADGLAAIGELQPEVEGPQCPGQRPRHIGRRVAPGDAMGARPDAMGHKDLESGGVGRYPDDRYRGLLGSLELQSIDRHDARKFCLWRPPGIGPLVRPVARPGRDRQVVKEAHGLSLDPLVRPCNGLAPGTGGLSFISWSTRRPVPRRRTDSSSSRGLAPTASGAVSVQAVQQQRLPRRLRRYPASLAGL